MDNEYKSGPIKREEEEIGYFFEEVSRSI